MGLIYWIFIIIMGLLFCQSVAFMLWQVFKFFSEVSEGKRWWISFSGTALSYLVVMVFCENITLAGIIAFFFTGMEVTYLLQDYFLHKFPHWERDGVLYLSLLLGNCVALSFWVCFYIIMNTM